MRSYFDPASRIVGGEAAADYAWPWQIYLTANGRFICGGTLIDRRYVLTAAHCIIGISNDPSDYLVRVGAHNMASQGYYIGAYYQVASIQVHESYISAEYGYDIALIQLYYAVDISSTVNVICLPQAGFEMQDYQLLTITGWGLLSEGGRTPTQLQQAVIQTLPTCDSVYSYWYRRQSQICAGLYQGGRDTCQGKKELFQER